MSRPQENDTECPDPSPPFHRTELFASLVVAGVYLAVFCIVFFSYVL